MAIPTLSGSYIDETFGRLVQTDGIEFADGLGNPITFGQTPTGSLLVTASVVGNTITFTKGNSDTFDITVSGGTTTIDTGSFVTTASFNDFTASYNTGSFTGSFTGSLEGTASFALTSSKVLGGTDGYIPLWSGSDALTSSGIFQNGSNIGIGTTTPGSNVSIINYDPDNNITNGITFGIVYNGVGFGINREALTGQIINPNWNGYQFTTQGSGFEFQEYDITGSFVDRFVWRDGKLGVGTTAPNYKLEVNGDIAATGQDKDIYINEVPVSPSVNIFNYLNFS